MDLLALSFSTSAADLGVHSRAQVLAYKPTETLIGRTMMAVVYPAFVRHKDDPDRIRSTFRSSVGAAVAVLWPISIALVLTAPETVAIILGPGWETAIVPLQALTVVAALRFSQRLLVTLSRAQGYLMRSVASNFGYVFILVGALALTTPISLQATAGSVALVAPIFFFVATQVSARLVGL